MPKISRGVLLILCLCFLNANGQVQSTITKDSDKIKLVVPIDWSRIKTISRESPQEKLTGKILLNANKYALNTWWTKHGFNKVSSEEYLNFKGITEHKIRPVAAEAEALAVSLSTGLYDAGYTGVDVNVAEEKTIQMIHSLVHAHRANIQNGWGRAWQSPLWAAYTTFAGWMMWDKLDNTTRLELLRMANFECDWVMSNKGKARIKTYRDLKGNIISPGDTGAEENAWDAEILGVTCAMMPDNPHRKMWMNQLIKLTLNAAARPSDIHGKKMYNGKPLQDWLVGSNINEDGTVINHHIVHPDYMADLFEFNSAKFFYFANLPIPKALIFNLGKIFHALADLKFKAGDTILGRKVVVPGGTIFKKNSGDIYYPVGTDWGKWRRMNFVMVNSIASILSNKKSIIKRAEKWELLQGKVVLNMQNRFNDGHTYLNKSEDSYPSSEEWVADKDANSYLIEVFKEIAKPVYVNKAY